MAFYCASSYNDAFIACREKNLTLDIDKNMVERSCIHPFIEQTQTAFQKSGSLKEAFGNIRGYQRHVVREVHNVSAEAKIPHMIGMSIVGLGGIVLYEYVRAHGIPLPDSREVVGGILPVASISEEDEYNNTDTFVWRYGREQGYDGERLRKKVDEHRKAGHGQIDRDLEAGRLTPEEAEKGRRNWDKKHGYRG